MTNTTTAHFDRQYQTHLKHLKLKGLQPARVKIVVASVMQPTVEYCEPSNASL